MDTAAGKKVQEKTLHKKLFATARARPDDHTYGKNGVDCHVDKHEAGDTASFIQQHEQNDDVEGQRVETNHQPAARSFDQAQFRFQLLSFFF